MRTASKALFERIGVTDEEAALSARGQAREVLVEGREEQLVGSLVAQVHEREPSVGFEYDTFITQINDKSQRTERKER